MKKAGKPGSQRMSGSTAFTITPIAAACSALLLATAAHAQEAPAATEAEQAEAPVTKVVVTGIRGSIESSIAAKKNAEGVVEVITAEDIGKLPDTSIAESLARLPGLAGQRVQGRAQVIAIRGMSPDFAGTLLNGREQVTTGDNRGVEFDQFPSELIYSATVYKTPDASLVGQGLSGTVDMRVVRPLDLRERKIALNGRVESNSNGTLNEGTSAKGARLSASYIDQFADNTIGVALGIAHLDSPGQELHYKAWGFEEAGPTNFCQQHEADWGCSPATGIPDGATFLNGFEAGAFSRSQKRTGVMGVFEYKPSKDFHSTVDLYYSKFAKDETMRGLMGGLGGAWNGNQGAQYSNVELTPVGEGQLVTGGIVNVGQMVVRNDLNTRDDELKAVGWNTSFALPAGWRGMTDLSYSRADRTENVIETYAGTDARANFAFEIPTGAGYARFVPDLNYADPQSIKLMDAAGWNHDALWKMPKVTDELKSLRLEARHGLDFSIFNHVELGVNVSDRQKLREMNELKAMLKNGREPVAVPAHLLSSPTSLSYAGIPGVLSFDVMGALTSLYDLSAQAENEIIKRNYTVQEKVTTAYAKFGIDSQVGDVPVTGNFGLQFVHTNQGSEGYTRVGWDGPVAPNQRSTSYNNVLPSLNLNFDLGNDQYVRAGVAKTLARGRMDDLRAGNEVNIDPTSRRWSGSGGNPELRPWLANSFDLSYEKYFGKRSYVALAGFHKKLLNYIYNQTVEYDFTGTPNLTGIEPAGPIGMYNRPQNGQGGTVKGLELSGALDAGMLLPALEGFGLQASLSRTMSDIQPEGPAEALNHPTKLPGLSGNVAGLTVYYEKHGFSARVGQRYRSAYRGEISGLHNERSFTEINAERQTDLQFGYEFSEGRLKGTSLLFQVNNATDTPYSTYNGRATGVMATETYDKYGRQYLFGVNYKL